MKLIKEKQHVLKDCAVVGQKWFYETVFEVEASDVGMARDNYNGFQHATHRFGPHDVGRHITVSEPWRTQRERLSARPTYHRSYRGSTAGMAAVHPLRDQRSELT